MLRLAARVDAILRRGGVNPASDIFPAYPEHISQYIAKGAAVRRSWEEENNKKRSEKIRREEEQARRAQSREPRRSWELMIDHYGKVRVWVSHPASVDVALTYLEKEISQA